MVLLGVRTHAEAAIVGVRAPAEAAEGTLQRGSRLGRAAAAPVADQHPRPELAESPHNAEGHLLRRLAEAAPGALGLACVVGATGHVALALVGTAGGKIDAGLVAQTFAEGWLLKELAGPGTLPKEARTGATSSKAVGHPV